MKALFIAPDIYVCDMVITCWELFNEPAAGSELDVTGLPRTENWLADARDANPDVMFYIDGAGCSGSASVETLKTLRDIAPFIHLCFDAGDPLLGFLFLKHIRKMSASICR